MSYQVLARKWRPRTFAELVGQEHVVRPLINALDHGRLHHAFLFTGTRGVGKTTIARILAKSLNCESGATSTPCGRCTACVEVDEGRFIDLIEVDAASRTKVDDTRELLDNVQYAPTCGRYKVYLIDEVHMLSGHSFNALLKTLEEPPPHVKFLLATTDPQKLPVTVLSRCLQFNLKRLEPAQIAGQLRKILDAEGVPYDEQSLKLIARSADGSMRDGLSLLDQAIAYGGGRVEDGDVRTMLGTIDHDTIGRLLDALAASDARALLGVVTEVADYSAGFESLLDELLLALYRIAIIQADPNLAEQTDGARLRRHAEALTPEDVQLYYQIGLMGRRDLAYAPDPRTGTEMTVLRMLAFRPAGVERIEPRAPAEPGTASPVPPPATTGQTTAVAPAGAGQNDWSRIAAQLKLTGLMRELVNNMTLESSMDSDIVLVLDDARAQLLNKDRERELKRALEDYYGGAIRLNIKLGRPVGETPAQEKQREEEERQQAAVAAINNDSTVKALQEQFNARINPGSIRPKV